MARPSPAASTPVAKHSLPHRARAEAMMMHRVRTYSELTWILVSFILVFPPIFGGSSAFLVGPVPPFEID